MKEIEITELEQCEKLIKNSFVDAGKAFRQIRDEGLYEKAGYKSFNKYCEERWGYKPTYVTRLIGSCTVVENLSEMVPIGTKTDNNKNTAQLPETESQARPLISLEKDEQAEVWQLVIDTAPEGKITATHVEDVVKEYKEEKKQEEKIKPKTTSKFNKTNDNIEWAQWTWNPVTGCKHDCKYCYARDIASRFNNGNFEPAFHEERLSAPSNTNPDVLSHGGSNVFVCSMADLFGTWVPNDWIYKVIRQVEENPQWTFLFLTKNPRRYESIIFPDNAWIGATVDTQARVKQAELSLSKASAKIKFISCEPMLEKIVFSDMSMIDWLIIGAKSKTSAEQEFQPQFRWVHELTDQAIKSGCKVYWKPNLIVRPREYPE